MTVSTTISPREYGFVRSDPAAVRICTRCGSGYEWRKSTSGLKMTYCGVFCEIGELGFCLEALERGTPSIIALAAKVAEAVPA